MSNLEEVTISDAFDTRRVRLSFQRVLVGRL